MQLPHGGAPGHRKYQAARKGTCNTTHHREDDTRPWCSPPHTVPRPPPPHRPIIQQSPCGISTVARNNPHYDVTRPPVKHPITVSAYLQSASRHNRHSSPQLTSASVIADVMSSLSAGAAHDCFAWSCSLLDFLLRWPLSTNLVDYACLTSYPLNTRTQTHTKQHNY